LGSRPLWADLHENWHACSGPWRNHAVQIWFQYFKGFQIYRGSKFPFSHRLCWSSLQHSHTTAWEYCNPYNTLTLLRESVVILTTHSHTTVWECCNYCITTRISQITSYSEFIAMRLFVCLDALLRHVAVITVSDRYCREFWSDCTLTLTPNSYCVMRSCGIDKGLGEVGWRGPGARRTSWSQTQRCLGNSLWWWIWRHWRRCRLQQSRLRVSKLLQLEPLCYLDSAVGQVCQVTDASHFCLKLLFKCWSSLRCGFCESRFWRCNTVP